jgi:hypothetical protein
MNLLSLVPTMSDVERIDDRRTGHERRHLSPWQNPQIYISFAALMLTLVLTVLGVIASQLNTISNSLQSTRDIMLTVTTRQTTEIQNLGERVKSLENAMETQSKAYNFNFSTRLAVVEAKAGVRPRKPAKDEEE